MHTITLSEQNFRIKRAQLKDVEALVALLQDDVLGSQRESEMLNIYIQAFQAIDRDQNQLLVAVFNEQDDIVGTMQLTLIPGLARQGATRLQIEAVRVSASARGTGLGSALFQWAAQYGREHGATIAQLTTDKRRTDAHRFYERLGYVATHEGMKLVL
ncbi:GNAT family N-acetyltransferase [Deinococcus humi]|uniref:GNAT superfamily N-acetyltransferase n=1 Tax=Deinococcus humi TaxID=662880 RepID=A0A7W8JVD2_9DEIO|nr:GNAT family N-acetyltransferase [Deinococcus humi]MBB5362501.1 GNAT superfamily N-acetyltransferase [Deinococcus humi]GGO28516.1 GNAT family acetyltransferase [Deinococcus humi]